MGKMIIVDDISAYYYLCASRFPIYGTGEPKYLDSIYDHGGPDHYTELPANNLFNFGPGQVHLLVTDSSMRTNPYRYKYRVCTKELPPKSVIMLTDDICVASPQLCLVELGRKVPLQRQIEMGDEMLGKYHLSLDKNEKLTVGGDPLMTKKELDEYLQNCEGMRGIKQARVAARYMVENSESPMETRAEMTISLPNRYGGRAVPAPEMNREIELPEHLWDLAERRTFRLDMSWPGKNFEIEYFGKETHPNTMGKTNEDTIRDTIINYLGLDSITITYSQIRRPRVLDLLVRTIEKKLGIKHYNPPFSFEANRQKLYDELFNEALRRDRMDALWQ